MGEHLTREQVLEAVRERLGGRGSGRRLARIVGVSPIAGAKWLREGIPRERVGLVSAITGIPAHVIRPDAIAPPAPKNESGSQAHRRSLTGDDAA